LDDDEIITACKKSCLLCLRNKVRQTILDFMLGLKKGIVELLSHVEQWHQLFADEAARLRAVVGEHLVAIEHVGSTSICGISAKPVIDVAIAVSDKSAGEKCVSPLEKIGYEYRGEHGIAGRFYFIKGEPRTYHLHMVLLGSDFWRSHLLFRNHLRENPKAASEYDHLKKDLAEKYRENRNAYQEGKTAFIENILKEAGFKNSENR
jgi:GrpB-like predicted nucleotidyltransferase (UPF0157 family)